MTGLEAITAQNGWAIASIGAIIVMSALSLLAVVISQVHKVLSFIERKFKFENN